MTETANVLPEDSEVEYVFIGDTLFNLVHYPEPDEQPVKQRGRPRKYATAQERINTLSKKQCAEKRERTKYRHELRREGYGPQLYLSELLQTHKFDKEWIESILREIADHELASNHL